MGKGGLGYWLTGGLGYWLPQTPSCAVGHGAHQEMEENLLLVLFLNWLAHP